MEPTNEAFDNAGGAVLKDSGHYEQYLDLFSHAQSHVAASSNAGSDAGRKVVGSIPTALVSALCKDITEVTDDADDLQLLGIL
jgi:hypothetical protein